MPKERRFKMNECIFAEMRHFPPWPAQITEPTAQLGSPPGGNPYCVVFFGTKDFSWMHEHQLKEVTPDYVEKFKKKYKGKTKCIQACADMEKYMKTGDRSLLFPGEAASAFDKLLADTKPASASTSTPKTVDTSKKTPKSTRSSRPSTSKKRKKSVEEKSQNSFNSEVTPRIQPKQSKKNSCWEIFNAAKIFELSAKRDMGSNYIPPVFDVSTPFESILKKNIQPCNYIIGFIGLGQLGSRLAKCLLHSGHKLKVWNRSRNDLLEDFSIEGAESTYSPSELVRACDVIFCCLSDSDAVQSVIINETEDVLECFNASKTYIELSSIDIKTSITLSKAIKNKGGRYLECQPAGEAIDVETNELCFAVAGDLNVLDDCKSCFDAISDKLYINKNGEIGSAIHYRLVYVTHEINHNYGVTLLARNLKSQGVSMETLLCHLSLGKERLPRKTVYHAMRLIKADYSGRKLKYVHNDIEMIINNVIDVNGGMPLSSFAKNEIEEQIRRGYGDKDMAFLIEALI